MTDIRIIALDLDDTLLTKDLSISPANRRAISEAEAAGIAVILASGRIPFAMEPYIKNLGMDKRERLCICNNGACIMRSNTGEIVHTAPPLPVELGTEVFRAASEAGFPVELYSGNTIFVNKANAYTDLDVGLTGMKLEIRDLAPLFEKPQHKIVIPGNPGELQDFQKELKARFKANIFISKPYFLEVLPPEADKGIALSRVAELSGLRREEVLAVGDSMNDWGMIRYAGTGVAMANAVQGIKDIADFVTTRTNEEDGVAEVIERFVLSRIIVEA